METNCQSINKHVEYAISRRGIFIVVLTDIEHLSLPPVFS